MIDRDHPDLPVSRQCELLDLPRSTLSNGPQKLDSSISALPGYAVDNALGCTLSLRER